MGFFQFLFRLTLGGGAFVLLLLPVRALAGNRLSARWRRLTAAASLLFFMVSFHIPLPAPAAEAIETGAIPFALPAAPEPVTAPGKPAPAFPYRAALALWLGGTVLLAGAHTVSWLRFSRAATAAAKKADETMLSAYAAVCASMRIRRPPRLFLCAGVGAPMLAGIFRPRLLLPQGLDGRKLDFVLRHELTHYRSGDTLLKGLALAVSSLHWWNPLAHLPVRMLETDCELACDERLALSMNEAQRKQYGLTILELMGRADVPVTAAFSHPKKALRSRLDAMLRAKRLSAPVRAAAGCFAAALMACGVLASSVLADGATRDRPNPTFIVPLEDGRLAVSYENGYYGHFATDYSGPAGKGVLAAADGTVTQVTIDEKGSFVVVDHGGGLQTRYVMCDHFTVQSGDHVRRGQKLAEVDRNFETPHLHFETLLDGQPVNPAPYLSDAE